MPTYARGAYAPHAHAEAIVRFYDPSRVHIYAVNTESQSEMSAAHGGHHWFLAAWVVERAALRLGARHQHHLGRLRDVRGGRRGRRVAVASYKEFYTRRDKNATPQFRSVLFFFPELRLTSTSSTMDKAQSMVLALKTLVHHHSSGAAVSLSRRDYSVVASNHPSRCVK